MADFPIPEGDQTAAESEELLLMCGHAPGPEPLSPAAQAVLDAVCDNTEPDCDTQHLIAAALRAAAKHIKAHVRDSAPPTDWGQGWVEGVKNAACGLGLIANELEGQS